MDETSPDHDERIQDFFARHGGPGSIAPRKSGSAGAIEGWSEVYAGDGYVLRCEWSAVDTNEKMTYSEIAPER